MANFVKHVGIIMDGNRRWAKKNKLQSVLNGHEKGAYKLIDACKWCSKYGIPYITVYAFSTENWGRSEYEVTGLFKLLENFFNNELDNCIKEGISIKISGNRSMFSAHILSIIDKIESSTEHCNKVFLNIALSYGGRDELIRAVRKCSSDVKKGVFNPEDIDESIFASYLDTSGRPDIDLVIRTGGNHRLSNFFPWQTVYSEIYFIDTLWPDFTEEMFVSAIKYYESTQINHGK